MEHTVLLYFLKYIILLPPFGKKLKKKLHQEIDVIKVCFSQMRPLHLKIRRDHPLGNHCLVPRG